MNITSGGKPITIIGNEVKVGDVAKDFILSKNDLSEATLSDYQGKVKVLSVVPSLDTGVCDAQTRRFNQELNDRDDIVVITISMDLPCAQARWCGASGLNNVVTLSAHKNEDFAKDYGVLIKELRLLTRSVFVLNENNEVTYVEYVPEVSTLPDFDSVLKHLNA